MIDSRKTATMNSALDQISVTVNRLVEDFKAQKEVETGGSSTPEAHRAAYLKLMVHWAQIKSLYQSLLSITEFFLNYHDKLLPVEALLFKLETEPFKQYGFQFPFSCKTLISTVKGLVKNHQSSIRSERGSNSSISSKRTNDSIENAAAKDVQRNSEDKTAQLLLLDPVSMPGLSPAVEPQIEENIIQRKEEVLDTSIALHSDIEKNNLYYDSIGRSPDKMVKGTSKSNETIAAKIALSKNGKEKLTLVVDSSVSKDSQGSDSKSLENLEKSPVDETMDYLYGEPKNSSHQMKETAGIIPNLENDPDQKILLVSESLPKRTTSQQEKKGRLNLHLSVQSTDRKEPISPSKRSPLSGKSATKYEAEYIIPKAVFMGSGTELHANVQKPVSIQRLSSKTHPKKMAMTQKSDSDENRNPVDIQRAPKNLENFKIIYGKMKEPQSKGNLLVKTTSTPSLSAFKIPPPPSTKRSTNNSASSINIASAVPGQTAGKKGLDGALFKNYSTGGLNRPPVLATAVDQGSDGTINLQNTKQGKESKSFQNISRSQAVALSDDREANGKQEIDDCNHGKFNPDTTESTMEVIEEKNNQDSEMPANIAEKEKLILESEKAGDRLNDSAESLGEISSMKNSTPALKSSNSVKVGSTNNTPVATRGMSKNHDSMESDESEGTISPTESVRTIARKRSSVLLSGSSILSDRASVVLERSPIKQPKSPMPQYSTASLVRNPSDLEYRTSGVSEADFAQDKSSRSQYSTASLVQKKSDMEFRASVTFDSDYSSYLHSMPKKFFFSTPENINLMTPSSDDPQNSNRIRNPSPNPSIREIAKIVSRYGSSKLRQTSEQDLTDNNHSKSANGLGKFRENPSKKNAVNSLMIQDQEFIVHMMNRYAGDKSAERTYSEPTSADSDSVDPYSKLFEKDALKQNDKQSVQPIDEVEEENINNHKTNLPKGLIIPESKNSKISTQIMSRISSIYHRNPGKSSTSSIKSDAKHREPSFHNSFEIESGESRESTIPSLASPVSSFKRPANHERESSQLLKTLVKSAFQFDPNPNPENEMENFDHDSEKYIKASVLQQWNHIFNTCHLLLIPLNGMFDMKALDLEIPNRFGRNNTSNHPAFKGFGSLCVSRNHLDIFEKNGSVFIKDIGSNSGTFRNHARVSPPGEPSVDVEVFTGDYIQLGKDFKYDGLEESQIRRRKCIKFQIVIIPVGKTVLQAIRSQSIPIENPVNRKDANALEKIETQNTGEDSVSEKRNSLAKTMSGNTEKEKKFFNDEMKRKRVLTPEAFNSSVDHFVLNYSVSGGKVTKLSVIQANNGPESVIEVNLKNWESKYRLSVCDRRNRGLEKNYELFLDGSPKAKAPGKGKSFYLGTPWHMVYSDGEHVGQLLYSSEMKMEIIPNLKGELNESLTLSGDFKDLRFICIQKSSSTREQHMIGESKGRRIVKKSFLETQWKCNFDLVDLHCNLLVLGASLLSCVLNP